MKTKERVLEVALQRFNEMGTTSVSTNHIADASGMSPGNLYYHFHNKEEIIRALVERMVASWGTVFALPADRAPGVADLLSMLEQNFALLWEYRFFYREQMALMQRDSLLDTFYRVARHEAFARCELLLQHFVDTGVLQIPDYQTSLTNLARVCWMISDYWLPFVELDEAEVQSTHIQQGVQLLLQVLNPYLGKQNPSA